MFTSLVQKSGSRPVPQNSDAFRPIAKSRLGRRMRRAQRSNGGNLLAV